MDDKPHTFVSTIRCDARDLAMVHVLLTSQGYKFSSVASIVSAAVGLLADLAVQKGVTERVEQTAEAIRYLEERNVVDILGSKRRNNKTLIDTLSQEDLVHDRAVTPRPILNDDSGGFDPGAFAEELARRQALVTEEQKHLAIIPEGVVKDESTEHKKTTEDS